MGSRRLVCTYARGDLVGISIREVLREGFAAELIALGSDRYELWARSADPAKAPTLEQRIGCMVHQPSIPVWLSVDPLNCGRHTRREVHQAHVWSCQVSDDHPDREPVYCEGYDGG